MHCSSGYIQPVLSNGWPLAAAACSRPEPQIGCGCGQDFDQRAAAGGCAPYRFLPVPILWYFPTSSYPLVFSYQFLSSVRPIGSYRATTVAAAILACESGGCGCGRDFIRTKTAWLRLDAAGCLNSTASSYYSGSVRYVSRRGCKSVQFSVFLIPIQVALDYIGKRGSTVGVTREKRIK